MKKTDDIELGKDLSGAGGSGGGGGGTPKRIPDNIRMQDWMEAVLGLGYGPIKGLAPGVNNKLENFKVGDTQLFNTGTNLANFPNFRIKIYGGYDTDPAIDFALGGAASNQTVNVNMQYNVPVTRTTSVLQRGHINRLEVRLVFQRLVNVDSKQNTSDGTAQFRIEYKPSGSGVWSLFNDQNVSTMTGKTSSNSPKDFIINVPLLTEDDWDIRVTKLTEENQGEVGMFADFIFESIQMVETSPKKYEDIACVHLIGRATNEFSSVPDFSGTYDGLITPVPSNYDPVAKTYNESTPWDGTWKMAFHDNPAFHLRNLILNPVYGLATYYLHISVVDAEFYAAGKWCDDSVPVGATGRFRPRFTMNMVVQEAMDGMGFLRYIAGAFNSTIFDDGNGNISLRTDAPRAPSYIFTPENVSEDGFSYAYTDLTTRHNDITVVFANKNLEYAEDRRKATIDNTSVVARNGLVPLEFIAVGCTNVDEAVGRANYRYMIANTETATVSFRTTRLGMLLDVYDTIYVADPNSGWSTGGRVKSLEGNILNLRDPIYFATQAQVTLRIQTYEGLRVVQGVPMDTGVNYRLQLSSVAGLSEGEFPDRTTFTVEDTTVHGLAKPFRIISIEESEEGLNQYAISAIEVNINKYHDADLGVQSEDVPYSYQQPGEPIMPPELVLETGTAHIIVNNDGTLYNRIYASWERPLRAFTAYYELDFKAMDDSTWTTVKANEDDAFLGPVKDDMLYHIRLFAVTPLGKRGRDYLERINFRVSGKSLGLDVPTNVTVAQSATGYRFAWDNPDDGDYDGMEIRRGGVNHTWDTATIIARRIKDNAFQYQWLPVGTSRFFFKYRDTSGNESNQAVIRDIEVQAPPVPVVKAETRNGLLNLVWADVRGTQPTDVYQFRWGTADTTPTNATPVAQTRGTTLTVGLNDPTIRRGHLRAIDVAGNVSGWTSFEVGMEDTVDPTPPPTVTGLVATPALNSITIKTDVPTYKVGHGHRNTRLYATQVTTANPDPAFNENLFVGTFVGSVETFPATIGTKWRFWAKWTTNDGYDSVSPSASADAETGKIGDSQLADDLDFASKLADGSITASKIAAGAIDATKFAAGVEPVTVIPGTTVPTTKSTSSIVVDGQTYVWDNATGKYIKPGAGNINAEDIEGLIEAGQIKDGSITTSKLADGALTPGKFAAGIEPVTIIPDAQPLPTVKGTSSIVWQGSTYLWDATEGKYIKPGAGTVNAEDIEGLIQAIQIADGSITSQKIAPGAIDSTKFAQGIEPVTIVSGSTLPTVKSTTSISFQGKLYTWDGTKYALPIAGSVDAADIQGLIEAQQIKDGAITASKVAAGAIDATKFASGLEPIRVIPSTSALPTAKNGETISWKGELYRWSGTAYVKNVGAGDITGQLTSGQIADLAAAKLTGQIVGTQISDNAISTPKLAAGAVIADKIAANAVTADKIIASAITADKLAVNSVAADKIQANAIQTSHITAGAVKADQIAAGAITATKMALGDFTNIVPDGAMQEAAAWPVSGQWTYYAAAVPGLGTEKGLRHGYVAGQTGISGEADSTVFPVEGGKPYYFEYRSAGGGAQSYKVIASVFWLTTGPSVAPTVIADTASAGTAAVIKGLQLTAPADATRAFVMFQVDRGVSPTNVYIGGVVCRRANGGELIVDGAITATKIAANAITADKIAANSIVASKLTLTDSTNIFPDYDALDESMYTPSSAGMMTFPTTDGVNFGKHAVSLGASTTLNQTVRIYNTIGGFQVEPNTEYSLTAMIPGTGDTTLRFYTREGSLDAAGQTIWGSDVQRLTRTAAQGVTTSPVSTSFTTGATTRRMSILLRRDLGGTVNALFGGISLRRKNGAELIVDGAITAGKIAANAVSADTIQANAVTAGKIAAAAINAREIAAGAITASKLMITGAVDALNPDSTFTDQAVWDDFTLTGAAGAVGRIPQVVAAPDAYSGNTVLRGTGFTWPLYNNHKFPIDETKQYLLEVVARQTAGTGGPFYGCWRFYDAAGVYMSSLAGLGWPSVNGAIGYYAPSAAQLTAAWQRFSYAIGANAPIKIPPGARFMSAQFILNYNVAGTTNISEIGLLRVGEMVAGELIVDGSITADKIRAGSITAGKIAVGDFSNIVPDSGMTDIGAWLGTKTDMTFSPSSSFETASRVAIWANTTGYTGAANAFHADFRSVDIPVEPGKAYYFSANFRSQLSNTAGVVQLQVVEKDQTGTELAITLIGAAFTLGATTVEATRSGQLTLSPTTVAVVFRVRQQYNAAGVFRGIWYFYNPVMRRANDGELIVDGAISANKIQANSITASKLVLTDSSNIFPDFNFYDESSYTGNEAAPFWTWPGTSSTIYGRRAISLPSAATDRIVYAFQNNMGIQVRPSTEYFFEVGYQGAGTEAITGVVEGAVAANGTVTWGALVPLITKASATVSGRSSATFITAATTRLVAVYFLRPGGGTAAALFGGVVIRQKSNASLIVDGSITAEKVAANAITVGKIAAGAVKAEQIAAGSVTASKLTVTGAGDVLNPDPNFEDPDVWAARDSGTGAAGVIVTTADAYNGAKVLELTDYATGYYDSYKIPVDPKKQYLLETVVRRLPGATGTYFTGFKFYTATGALITPGGGNGWPSGNSQGNNYAPSAVVPPETVWTRYAYAIGGDAPIKIPATAAYMSFLYLAGYSTGTGKYQIGRIAIAEMKKGELLVDGAITADKIAAGAITADKIAANSITASKLMLTDATNLYPDYDFMDTGSYTGTANTWLFENSQTAGTGRKLLVLLARTTNVVTRGYALAGFQVEPDTEYVISAVMGCADAVARIYTQEMTLDANGAIVAGPDTNRLSRSAAVGTSVVTASFTTSATTRRMQIAFRRDANGTASAYFGGLTLRRKNGGELIVDGAITAAKIAVNAITADKIQANAITAGKIAAGAVNADQIVAGAITASKLAIGDFSNLIPDAMMEDASSWTRFGTWAMIASPAVGFGTTNILRMPLTTAAGYGATARSSFFSVEAGRSYYLEFKTSGVTTGNYRVQAQVVFQNSAGAQLSAPVIDNALSSGTAILTKGLQVVAPANAARAQIALAVHHGDTVVDVNVGAFVARRANSGELIVDGAITATKLAANSIVVGTAAIQNAAITNAMIASLSADKITTGFLDAARIQAGTIVTGHLAANVITSDKIVAGSIDASKIAARSITADRIVAGAITASELVANNAFIIDGTLQGAKIQDASIYSAKIVDATISTAKIGVAQIDTLRIAGNSIVVGSSLPVTESIGVSSGSATRSHAIWSAYGGTPIVFFNFVCSGGSWGSTTAAPMYVNTYQQTYVAQSDVGSSANGYRQVLNGSWVGTVYGGGNYGMDITVARPIDGNRTLSGSMAVLVMQR